MSIWDRLPWKNRGSGKATSIQDVAYKRMHPPSPPFFSLLLSGVFMDERFGLAADEMQHVLGYLPQGLEKLGPIWVNVYLSWVLSKLVAEKYGHDFAKRSIDEIKINAARVESVETTELLNLISFLISHWYPIFDLSVSLRNEPDCPTDIKEASDEFTIAYGLMKHGPDGPLFFADEDGVQRAISAALLSAFSMKQDQYKRMVEVGAMLEEVE